MQLDYAAGVVPVGFVDAARDALPESFTKSATYAGFNDIERGIYSIYDAKAMHGLPLGVQIVGGRLQEEKTLAGMRIVEDALRATGNPFVQRQF